MVSNPTTQTSSEIESTQNSKLIYLITSIDTNKAESQADLIDYIQRGIPSSAFNKVTDYFGLSKKEMANILSLNAQTIARRKDGLLNKVESARLVRFCRVVDRTNEVLGSKNKSLLWLKSANQSLNDHTPISFLDTDVGTNMIFDVLGKIEHGVFA